jgi:ribonuclease HI
MEALRDNALSIFTDGSQLSNPRRGGCAFILVCTAEDGSHEVHERCVRGNKGATNQEMELKAAVEALKLVLGRHSPVDLRRFERITVYTDSQYLAEGADRAAYRWSRQKWTRRGGAPLVNTELWQELLRLRNRRRVPVYFEWRKGKSSEFTRRVDRLAKESARGPLDPPITFRSVGHAQSDQPVDQGSVVPTGQILEIRIVEKMFHRLQRRWRFKYEVLSDGPDIGKKDFVYGREHLSRGATYTVRLNDDPDFPQIVEVLRVEETPRDG